MANDRFLLYKAQLLASGVLLFSLGWSTSISIPSSRPYPLFGILNCWRPCSIRPTRPVGFAKIVTLIALSNSPTPSSKVRTQRPVSSESTIRPPVSVQSKIERAVSEVRAECGAWARGSWARGREARGSEVRGREARV
ncbi:hypothetical protein EVAR_44343_1 [Eumeta japonica]|uniref:Uncharacterized protein n=1 Tax=Eumeta variegata TaxID=151549 RepID=A0A4C1X7M1_EUMVA|nr:hypothetical protein EVAR_44343_1 [Eumeta japonica]